jgi:hypothetical protein
VAFAHEGAKITADPKFLRSIQWHMRVKLALVLAAAAVLCTSSMEVIAFAQSPSPDEQSPGFYRVKVGEFEVTSLYDGGGIFDSH